MAFKVLKNMRNKNIRYYYLPKLILVFNHPLHSTLNVKQKGVNALDVQ